MPRPVSLDALLDRQQGILKLDPAFARRRYRDAGRLSGKKPGQTFIPRYRMWVPERWITSTTQSALTPRVPGEGLSFLAGTRLSLRDALAARGERMLGRARYRAHGPEFRVLVKILDGDVPIVFHFHASDQAVRQHRDLFARHRFGKDEAYYFLDRPKGACPYTHVGLRPGTTRQELKAAVEAGTDAMLRRSPVFLQAFEEGFYVPAGVVHRPGTAMTLEIQQPSDVSIVLDDRMGDIRFTPAQMRPGFRTLDQALQFVDMKTSTDGDILEKFRLVPSAVRKKPLRGAVEDWIFPPRICRKFSGKRLRVTSRTATIEPDCYGVLVWKGAGRFGPHPVRSGDEFFVTHEAAEKGVTVERESGDCLELFKFFPAPL